MEQENNKLLVINPYNDQHILLVKQFENKLNYKLPCQVSDILLKIRKTKTQEEYQKIQQESTTFEENLYLVVDGQLVSSCFVEGNRQTKKAIFSYITLPEYRGYGYATKLLNLSFDYVTSFMGIDTVELDIDQKNGASRFIAESSDFTLIQKNSTQSIYQRNIREKEVKQL